MVNKGNLLEDFAEALLNSMDGFVVRYKRVKASATTKDPEHDYDLIVHNSSKIFPEFGDYILVECKDWQSSVGYAEIAKFLHKLHSRKCATGIMFAMGGVVYGRLNPTLRRTFDQDGIAVIVLKEQDISKVMEGIINLSTLIRKKYEQVRFGLY